MTAPAKARGQRSIVASWVYQNLVLKRTPCLAALILLCSLLTMRSVIHPLSPQGNAYRQAVPFLKANGAGIDYYQFWVVGQARAKRRLDNIYSTEDRSRLADLGREVLRSSSRPSERLASIVQVRGQTIQTFSTPFLYAVVNAFSSDQYEVDFAFFQDGCLAALIASLFVIGWILHFSWTDCLLLVAMTVMWSEPLASDLRVGNVNQLQLFGVTLYLLVRSRSESLWSDILGGAVLGMLVAFKPTLGVIPMLLTLAWVIDGRWSTLLKQGGAAVVAAGMACGVGCLFLNSWSAWTNWSRALLDLENVSGVSVDAGNYSLAQIIREMTSDRAGLGADPSALLLAAVLVVAAIAIWLTRRRPLNADHARQARMERDFLVTSLGCAVSIVTLKLVWLHYYILLLPLLLYVLRPAGWVSSQSIGVTNPRIRVPMTGLILAVLALCAGYGWPLVALLEISVPVQHGLYIGGAWGSMLLGLAGLWFPTPAPQQTAAISR